MPRSRPPQRRHLIGRSIVDFQPNPRPDGRGGTVYDPVIVLDDGSRLCFIAQETEWEPMVRVLRVFPAGKE